MFNSVMCEPLTDGFTGFRFWSLWIIRVLFAHFKYDFIISPESKLLMRQNRPHCSEPAARPPPDQTDKPSCFYPDHKCCGHLWIQKSQLFTPSFDQTSDVFHSAAQTVCVCTIKASVSAAWGDCPSRIVLAASRARENKKLPAAITSPGRWSRSDWGSGRRLPPGTGSCRPGRGTWSNRRPPGPAAPATSRTLRGAKQKTLLFSICSSVNLFPFHLHLPDPNSLT